MSPALRNFRCDDDLWAAAKEAASRRQETVTDVLVRALREYVEEPEPERSAAHAD